MIAYFDYEFIPDTTKARPYGSIHLQIDWPFYSMHRVGDQIIEATFA